jgi:hypothetical protein
VSNPKTEEERGDERESGETNVRGIKKKNLSLSFPSSFPKCPNPPPSVFPSTGKDSGALPETRAKEHQAQAQGLVSIIKLYFQNTLSALTPLDPRFRIQ